MTSRTERLGNAADSYRDAKDKLANARLSLSREVRDAAKDGMRQVDILKATDNVWTREQVRKVVAADED